MLAKLQAANKFTKKSKRTTVLSQITSKLAHAEEIDQRLNRRKETIIKLQSYIAHAEDDEEIDSD